MIVLLNETRTHKVQNETLNGVNIVAMLTANADNVTIGDTDHMTGAFDPSMVNISVILKRKNGAETHQILNTNLSVIAAYNTLLKNGSLWRKGITLTAPAANVKHVVTRSVFLYFGGHINVAGTDELLITMTMNRGTFSNDIDVSSSSIQFEPNQSVGVEVGIPKFDTYAIQASQSEDSVNIGDNCMRVALISFEKDPYKPIFTGATLASDRLDWNKNEQELILAHYDAFDYNAADKLINDLAVGVNPAYFPNSRMIHKWDELDRCKVKVTLRPANVQTSKNFICYNTYVTSQEILDKAVRLKSKHNDKDAAKVPLTTNSTN